MAGMAVGVLPDADIVSRYFGVPHTADFGHRGATHTLAFALFIAALALAAPRQSRNNALRVFTFILISTLSHPLADMMNDGGKGIMLLWPLDHDRFKFLLHPVKVSAVGLQGLETGTIWPTLWSELLWLLLPAALLAAMARFAANSHTGAADPD